MHRKRLKIHIGLRAVKTILSVLIAMMIVDAFGATTARMIFACRDCENNEANGSLRISGRLFFLQGNLRNL